MVGTVVLNLFMGLLGFIIAFSFSLLHNGIMTSSIRGIYAFLLFFLLTYVFRYIIAYIWEDKATRSYEKNIHHDEKTNTTSISMEDDVNLSTYIQDLLNSDESNIN